MAPAIPAGSGRDSGVPEDRLRNRLDFRVVCLGVVQCEPAHPPDDPRNFTCRQQLAVANHDGNQAVAIVLCAESVLHFALYIWEPGSRWGEQDNHGVGLLQGVRDLASPIISGQNVLLRIPHFQPAFR